LKGRYLIFTPLFLSHHQSITSIVSLTFSLYFRMYT